MATIRLAPNGFGGIVQGNFGNYQAASDGSFTVDTRDVASLLAQGFTYLSESQQQYTTPLAPPAATVGAIIASGALSNGTVAITSQPTVMRPVTIEVGTGTGAITAGVATVTYVANDGNTQVDTFSLVAAASTSTTQTTSKGVDTVSSVIVSGVTGGVSPWLRASTTTAISVPVGNGAIDVAFIREYDSGATVALGTPTAALASIIPSTTLNGTATYSFTYASTSANI